MQNPLGYEKESSLLKKFAIPSIISMLVSSLYNIVDQIFIGQGVGFLGNAATNVAFPLTTIALAIALLIGIGSASLFSLYLGEKKPERSSSIAGNGISMSVLCSVIYVVLVLVFLEPLLKSFGATSTIMPLALEYTRITTLGVPFLITTNVISNLIRADGSPKYSMTCMVAGAIVNTILDPLFIFVFHMGVAGAAIATVAGQVISFFIAAWYINSFQHIEFNKKSLRISLKDTKEMATIGMSASLNQIAILFVQIVLNNSLTYYGQFTKFGSDIPLAACGIVMKTNAILLAIIIGISQGMQPIIGFNYGAQKYERVKKTFKLAISANLVVSFIGWALFQFCTSTVLSIFGSGDANYFEFATMFMRIYLMLVCVDGVQMLSSSFFSSIKKAYLGMFLSMTRQVLFLIPLVLILVTGYGLLQKVDIFDAFIEGAVDGFKTVYKILPTLIGLMIAIGILRESGTLGYVASVIAPVTERLHFPSELVPLVTVKMFSSSAATGLLLDIYKTYGTDSYLGTLSSVLMSCSETIFYTMSVYFMTAKVTKTRYTLAGALFATFVGAIASVLLVGVR